ncbi:MAG: hypothetical protein U0169_22815 [Polyangiaceae bacterium]
MNTFRFASALFFVVAVSPLACGGQLEPVDPGDPLVPGAVPPRISPTTPTPSSRPEDPLPPTDDRNPHPPRPVGDAGAVPDGSVPGVGDIPCGRSLHAPMTRDDMGNVSRFVGLDVTTGTVPQGHVDVLAIGVYEADPETKGVLDGRGMVFVQDTRTTPHVLILTAYEPTVFSLGLSPDAVPALRKIVLAGYGHHSVIAGGHGIPVVDVSGRPGDDFACTYSIPSSSGCESRPLFELARAQGGELDEFIGTYSASMFLVVDPQACGTAR